jgi:alkylresorcinol/alkylpyrone synthase
MSIPAILRLTTGVPSTRYSQAEILQHLVELIKPSRSRAMQAIFERTGVGYRHMVVNKGYYDEERTTQERNDFYMSEAIPLGERVIRQGLEEAGFTPKDIDDFIVVSCTGFNIPGLDLHLAGRLGMRSDLRRTCVLGMGCYGAFPGLLRACEAAQSGRLVLVLALELCSLHLQFDDSSENIVSTALFADGAGMALVGNSESRIGNHHPNPPQLVTSATHCDYSTLEHMSFNVSNHGFRMYLSSYVPDLLVAQIGDFVDGMLNSVGVSRSDVRYWGIHPGSTKIIDYVQKRLGLHDAQVEHSHSVLYDYGNMSSATIFFVLERIQKCEQPSSGDYGVLLAFGPGLTIEGLLVRW